MLTTRGWAVRFTARRSACGWWHRQLSSLSTQVRDQTTQSFRWTLPNTQSYSEYTKEFSFPGISDDQIRAMTLVWDSFSSVMSPTRLRSHQTPSSEVEMFTCDVCHKRAQIETLNHYSILALPTVFVSQCSFSFESGSVASGQSAISSPILPQSSRMMSSDSQDVDRSFRWESALMNKDTNKHTLTWWTCVEEERTPPDCQDVWLENAWHPKYCHCGVTQQAAMSALVQLKEESPDYSGPLP